jgi:5'-deoxynucleotidase YfbR-like HD superfamily hydrolase
MASNPWIQTYTGRAFDLLDPQPEQIDIVDIAHSLSNLCRFTGHAAVFYSVAQHSCLVAELTRDLWRSEHGAEPPDVVLLAALLHDAAEAYVGDVSTPLKRAMREISFGHFSYDQIEARVHKAIAARFGIHPPEVSPLPDFREHCDALIKRADLIALATEHRDLFNSPTPRSWGLELPDAWPGRVDPWPPHVARREFLQTFTRYGGVR